jgi:hypothetical protein
MTRQWRGCLQSAGVVATILGLAFLPGTAASQTVRGTVYDQVRPAPAVGAIVTLERVRSPLASPEQGRSVLTYESGSYAIRAT